MSILRAQQVQRRTFGVRPKNLRKTQERQYRSSDGPTCCTPFHQGHGVSVRREDTPRRHC